MSLLSDFISLLNPGLPGSISRSSASDIKREDKEDDENSSIPDKSEDEKKDIKARIRTRCLKKPLMWNRIFLFLLTYTWIRFHVT